jgi:hypothetical protein
MGLAKTLVASVASHPRDPSIRKRPPSIRSAACSVQLVPGQVNRLRENLFQLSCFAAFEPVFERSSLSIRQYRFPPMHIIGYGTKTIPRVGP